ncbi:hypothetical protein PFAG_05945 [Plasmodium falciparum Santa Lucia]|uniref:Plasmodium falciparum erythrocyte membrane protein 1 acidic terminal segment domain-containing protein n=3 Tax=Plasmodium falciparum TaxID=5833 RepID=W4J5P6_PLAFP|nr:hypothetical protein PFUGPA_00516 [Plasmodium falciparum Palo Alto/Uganda]ETW58060.1 hypothetical protein PFMC_06044 [Plasmodium falciparum CAMP/Malaysia]EUT76903.1 hypothetical protein PFAG_05945 [Plasmodium falciparum Santa Lucia]
MVLPHNSYHYIILLHDSGNYYIIYNTTNYHYIVTVVVTTTTSWKYRFSFISSLSLVFHTLLICIYVIMVDYVNNV